MARALAQGMDHDVVVNLPRDLLEELVGGLPDIPPDAAPAVSIVAVIESTNDPHLRREMLI